MHISIFVRYLTVFYSNLDEFFRVKINQLASHESTGESILLNTILKETRRQPEQFGTIWHTLIIHGLLQCNNIVYQDRPIKTCCIKERVTC